MVQCHSIQVTQTDDLPCTCLDPPAPQLPPPAPNVCRCPLLSLLATSQFSPVDLCRSPFLFFGCKYVPLYAEQRLSFCFPSFECVLFTSFPLFLLLISTLLIYFFDLFVRIFLSVKRECGEVLTNRLVTQMHSLIVEGCGSA